MAGLDPAIHVFFLGSAKTWMPGTSLDKPGHDELERMTTRSGHPLHHTAKR
jgi:hypothetical protein